ncbi:MAG: PEP-CTERM sorting domain-containing protein [Opitutaceae bacterium]|nr:PEP-CTERM sorting domain-containing protein [Opitutaceae bacterium]
MKSKYLFSLLLPAVSLCVSPLAHGTLVFEDDFNSGVSGWTTNTSSSTFVSTSTAGPIAISPAAHYVANGGSGDARFAASAAFSPVTLHAGESISLSFDYKGITYSANNGSWFIFGLSDSGNSAGLEDDKGYLSAIGADTRTAQSARARYYSYSTGIDPSTANINGGSVDASRSTPYFQLNGEPAIAEDSATGNIEDSFHFAFVITRETNGDLSFVTTFTNVTQSTESAPVSFTSTATIVAADIQTYRFDTINIGCIRRSGAAFAVDNVLVDYQAVPVPEPATVASLLGLGALLACAFLRKRR